MRIRFNKKTIIALVLCIGVVFMAVGYSILQTELKISGGANITSTWDVRITGITVDSQNGTAYNLEEPSFTNNIARFKVALVNPGDYMTYTVTIKNQGTLTALLNSINLEQSGTDAIIYEVSGIKDGDTLAAGQTKTVGVTAQYKSYSFADPLERAKTLNLGLEWVQYTNQDVTVAPITIKYNLNGGTGTISDQTCYIGTCWTSVTRPSREGYIFRGWALSPNGPVVYLYDDAMNDYFAEPGETVTLYAIWDNNLKNIILRTNTVLDDSGINFGAMSSDTNGKGLYSTNTRTEGNKTTYYFRGTVTNNYVSFAGETWRIVRINEDGSVRLIKAIPFWASSFGGNSDNVYVGYMYGTPGSSTYALTHANINNSPIKTYLDNWYVDYLSNYGTYLADAGFCNDRSIATTANTWHSEDTALGYGTNVTYYGAYNRLYNIKQPQFACPQTKDLFTTYTSSKGNKALKYPIGLITADEVAYAGGAIGNNNTSYYLYTGSYIWTMTPSRMGGRTVEFNINPSGQLNESFDNNNAFQLHPVINLKADVQVSSGNGTSSSPYVIKTN